jgi:hypothetical protein
MRRTQSPLGLCWSSRTGKDHRKANSESQIARVPGIFNDARLCCLREKVLTKLGRARRRSLGSRSNASGRAAVCADLIVWLTDRGSSRRHTSGQICDKDRACSSARRDARVCWVLRSTAFAGIFAAFCEDADEFRLLGTRVLCEIRRERHNRTSLCHAARR